MISMSNNIYPPNLVKTASKIGNNGFNGQNVNLSYAYGTVDNLDQDPRPQTLEQLKENIRRIIRDIPQETFPAVMENMAVRMHSVIGKRGGYVDHMV